MFHYVEDKEYLSCIRRICGEIMQDLCHILKKDYDIGAVPCLVGTGLRFFSLPKKPGYGII